VTDILRLLERRLVASRAQDVEEAEIDLLLNDGYGRVLELEADRSRLARAITEMAEIAREEGVAERLLALSQELRDVDRELARTRDLLAEVEHLAGTRSAPTAGRG
jgi:5-carboxymethyl-2-hydroxymuconate isomerase